MCINEMEFSWTLGGRFFFSNFLVATAPKPTFISYSSYCFAYVRSFGFGCRASHLCIVHVHFSHTTARCLPNWLDFPGANIAILWLEKLIGSYGPGCASKTRSFEFGKVGSFIFLPKNTLVRYYTVSYDLKSIREFDHCCFTAKELFLRERERESSLKGSREKIVGGAHTPVYPAAGLYFIIPYYRQR